MLAEASPVDRIIAESSLTFGGVEIAVVQLRGHSPRQVGFLVDEVFFSADVVVPDSVLEK